ncbi:MAG: hypothetical protein GXY36_19135, partial [Chloroflexi bacterium]|nr:hypothetical protein [Chloroflexota bacterium]
VLAPPLLATLAYTVYEYTQRDGFLRDTFDGLLAFFRRWLQPDLDQDGDGLPEWSRPEQGAFGDSPTLARSRRWAQGANINTIEAPDLAAYLLREAASLIQIAQVLGDQGVADEVALRRDALREHLQAMWNPETGAFHYRDRDTDAVPLGEIIFEGKGDQPLRDRTPLPHASRLILRVIGGMSHKPRVGCTIEGVNGNGQPTHETLDANAFDWYRGMGSATTRTVWREITDLKFDGLSRVYTVQVSTVDLSRHDQSLFVPLWTDAVTPEQVEQMVAMLTDPARYGREYGIPACPANDPAYDPTQQNGCGAVWPRWTTLIAWGLLDHGYRREAAMLFERLLNAQIRSLTTEQVFRALYNPDTGEGLGDSDVLEGVVSLGWFARLFGAFVPRSGCVMITGPLAFEGQPMVWTQHGIRIERSPDSTAIRFASGHSVTLPPDAGAQLICDEQPAAAEPPPLARTDPADPGTPNVEPESALPVDDAEPDDEQPALPPYDGLLPDVD